MASGIFLINNDGELIELSESRFESEDIFQTLLGKYPNLLAGELIDPVDPRKWVLVTREMGIPDTDYTGDRWAVDHLFLDQDGIPTLVEVKRSSDSRIRREVIGQMLDYAANAITYWPVEKIIAAFEETCKEKDENPEEVINDLSGDDIDLFWNQVKTNLKAGKIRMIFLADEIPPELKRIVEFLNEQMDPAVVLALEIRQFKAEGLQTLVPTLYGNTSEAEKRKTTSYSKRDPWTEEEILKKLRTQCLQKEMEVAEKLLHWSKNHFDGLDFGRGKTMGSLIPWIKNKDDYYSPFTFWSTGYVELSFQYLANKKPFDNEELRLTLLEKFNHINDLSLQKTDINKRPSVKFDVLARGDNLNRFLEVIEWFMEKVKQSDT